MNPYRPPEVGEPKRRSEPRNLFRALAVVSALAAVSCGILTALIWLIMCWAWASPSMNDFEDGTLPVEFRMLSFSLSTALSAVLLSVAVGLLLSDKPWTGYGVVLASALLLKLGYAMGETVYDLLPRQ